MYGFLFIFCEKITILKTKFSFWVSSKNIKENGPHIIDTKLIIIVYDVSDDYDKWSSLIVFSNFF